MKMTQEELQTYFNTDLEGLKSTPEEDLHFLEQNHFGDLLIEVFEKDDTKFRLWRNLDCNDSTIEIEYFGILNGYTWETIFEESIY